MKKIEAIIRASKFEAVKEALKGIGINFFTFVEVKGYGKQKGDHVVYRGAVYDVGYIARVLIEIIIDDDDLPKAVSIIKEAASTGEFGDGKIVISSVEELISIRTGLKNESAL